jgi:ribosomal protein L12E/L44/L45/RPP1/RPP2
VLCLTLALMVPTYAQNNQNSISSNTIITEDNLYQVLEYLGIDSSNFEKSEVTGASVSTVGELEKAIKEAQKPKSITATQSSSSSSPMSTDAAATAATAAGSGTTMLYRTLDVGGSYTVEYEVSASFANGLWTSANSAAVSVDSDFLLYTYRIGYKELNLYFTPTKITLDLRMTMKNVTT